MPELSAEEYYRLGFEARRLDEFSIPLERARTEITLTRVLPPPPAVVADVGGAAGAYAFWLAGRGYQVHLIDPIPLHIEQARDRAAEPGASALASMRVGDARALELEDASVHAVLLLGPLYHLTERDDRLRALREARRVTKPGGVLIAAGISRFASLIDGLASGHFADARFREIVDRDLRDGQHRNPTDNVQYFATAFFHHPEELKHEITAAGWTLEQMLGVESLGAYAYTRGNTPALPFPELLALVDRVAAEPSLLGASPHLLAVARKTA
jgi:ubiquinone/menaquinone biosynthesis C-methylase UbiE